VSARSAGARRGVLVGLLLAASLLAGCASDGGAAAPDTSATSVAPTAAGVAPEGFGSVTVLVTLPDGTTRELCLWVADTGTQRARGLMGVSDPELGGLPGMLFRFPGDTSSGFWMKDTLLPLSIAWYDADGALVSTTDMAPCPAGGDCPTYEPAGPYRDAIEVPRGDLAELGLVPGSTIAVGAACAPPPAA
jgi:uncharacterized membrane protein (UPF0127 family)